MGRLVDLSKEEYIWQQLFEKCIKIPMEQDIYRFSLITEGTTEKVSQFIMVLLPFCVEKLCFNEQKCILELCRKVKD